MCEHGDTVDLLVTIPAHLAHNGVERQAMKAVDRCMAPVVDGFNRAGKLTAGSCCGHGKAPGGIIFHDGSKLVLFWAVGDDWLPPWADPVWRLRNTDCDLVETADDPEWCHAHQRTGGECLAVLTRDCPQATEGP